MKIEINENIEIYSGGDYHCSYCRKNVKEIFRFIINPEYAMWICPECLKKKVCE